MWELSARRDNWYFAVVDRVTTSSKTPTAFQFIILLIISLSLYDTNNWPTIVSPSGCLYFIEVFNKCSSLRLYIKKSKTEACFLSCSRLESALLNSLNTRGYEWVTRKLSGNILHLSFFLTYQKIKIPRLIYCECVLNSLLCIKVIETDLFFLVLKLATRPSRQ